MDGGAWWAAVHGVAKSWTRLSDITFTFHFHALEKEMATHSSVLAWRIPGTGQPSGLPPSMGSHRVGRDWSDLAAAAAWGAQVTLHILAQATKAKAWSTLYPSLVRNPCDPLGTQDWRLVRTNYRAISSSFPFSAVEGHREIVSHRLPHPEGWPVFLHPHLSQSVAQTLTLQHHHVAATQQSITKLALDLPDFFCFSIFHSGMWDKGQGASTFGQSSICCWLCRKCISI